MRNLYLSCFALLCIVLNAHAQFSGNYAPAKFTLTQTPGANGNVNTSGAPASIIITGSDDPTYTLSSQMDVDYTVRAVAPGIFRFDWSYHTNDLDSDPQYDPAGVLVNGVFTSLTTGVGINQSGSYSVTVTAGSIIGFRVRAIDNGYGTATLTISGFSAPASTLPVKLSLFTGKSQTNAIQLQWTAATEINTAFYEVQRSTNGINFTSIGKVVAGIIGGQYQFLDATPLQGKNYYRLRMVDNDGSFDYSGIVVLTTGNSLVQSKLSLYPNPATSAIWLTVQSPVASQEEVQLFNAAGAMISSETLALPAGSLKKEINIASLAPGTYFIRLSATNTTIPFVKK
ncbi:T9SS type A sorting domain-containing protein [Flavisolibacter ginsengisoli]|jgi:hypothetical protein|uniref:Por secretion system C-terminal sorting domain-containing protein n=1 Tax=Flavisolibacter ginsengisoli DSM 18119 TaxID=1121884 RepID=A0A1M5GF07_9BACT|nr:T9SS type A sorting domain-containing protein [Flavisolibacter ginsengisoli]SHG02278.1 Por secretion system C-terminal sorting domain-containing protein [Flavisolibacter ginsengisoli DSM 18119]